VVPNFMQRIATFCGHGIVPRGRHQGVHWTRLAAEPAPIDQAPYEQCNAYKRTCRRLPLCCLHERRLCPADRWLRIGTSVTPDVFWTFLVQAIHQKPYTTQRSQPDLSAVELTIPALRRPIRQPSPLRCDRAYPTQTARNASHTIALGALGGVPLLRLYLMPASGRQPRHISRSLFCTACLCFAVPAWQHRSYEYTGVSSRNVRR
jgi:hypothetical protein